MADPDAKISVVIPVYNSERSLHPLTQRLSTVLSATGREWEIVFVDDRSRDGSWKVLQQLKETTGERIKIIRLRRNSGQHNAVLCGFHHATGGTVITMDDDLQNPPEEIPKFLEKLNQGYDLVIGAYESKAHRALRNMMGRLIDWLQRKMFSLPADFQLTSFRAVKGKVVSSVCQMEGSYPYITCMLFSNTSAYANVIVKHEKRVYGESNYTIRNGLLLAANLVFGYSFYPLYLTGALCGAAFLFSLGYAAYVFVRALHYGIPVPGWASTVVSVAFLNALTLLALFVLSVYLVRLSRLFTRSRTGYVIDEVHD